MGIEFVALNEISKSGVRASQKNCPDKNHSFSPVGDPVGRRCASKDFLQLGAPCQEEGGMVGSR